MIFYLSKAEDKILDFVYGESRVKGQDYIGFVDKLYENLSWRVRKLILGGDVEKMENSVDGLKKRREYLLGVAFRRMERGHYHDMEGYQRELEVLVERTGQRIKDLRSSIVVKRKREKEGAFVTV